MRYRVAPKSYQRQLSWPVVWFMRRLRYKGYQWENSEFYIKPNDYRFNLIKKLK